MLVCFLNSNSTQRPSINNDICLVNLLLYEIKTTFNLDITLKMSKNKLFIVLIFSLLLSFNGTARYLEKTDYVRIISQVKDTSLLAFNKKQYGKMISKGDVLFSQKNYLNSKKLYQRAIRFQPDWDNTYPENRIIEIDRLLFELAQSIEVYVKEYQEKFQQGITEERIDLKFNNYNEIIAYEIIRVVVIGETYSIYKKHVVRSTVTYSKNGIGITKLAWDEESNNIILRCN